MNLTPRALYIKGRPLRIAFFIPNDSYCHSTLDLVFSYCRTMWGGRYNTVFILEGGGLAANDWSLLERQDPDIIVSYKQLSRELLAELDHRISPLHIQTDMLRADAHRLDLTFGGVTIPPSRQNIRRLSYGYDDPTLILLQTDYKLTSPDVRRFVHWNFGTFQHPIYEEEQMLSQTRRHGFDVTDTASLAKVLQRITEVHGAVYPIQLCALPTDAAEDVACTDKSEHFTVHVGETGRDAASFWNSIRSRREWMRSRLTHLWIPTALLDSEEFMEAARNWIAKASWLSEQSRGHLRIVSHSLERTALESCAANLRASYSPTIVQVTNEGELPERPLRTDEMPHINSIDLYQVPNSGGTVTIQAPESSHADYLQVYWAAEAYIAVSGDDPRFGRPRFLKLPRQNSIARKALGVYARVSKHRFPVAIVSGGTPRVSVALPGTEELLYRLICGVSGPSLTLDSRYGLNLERKRPYARCARSEKGRYLHGMVELFGGLEAAADVLETRFWRDLLMFMAGKNDSKDKLHFEKVRRTLAKGMHGWEHKSSFSSDDLTWLANYVIKQSRQLPFASNDLCFEHLKKLADLEMAEFNDSFNDSDAHQYSEKGIKALLTNLLERGVLISGLQPICPTCGHRGWYPIETVNRQVQCLGCNTAYPLPPELRWWYRLNTLVKDGCNYHGLVPVALALSHIAKDSQHTFLHVPCLDLFDTHDGEPVGDLDIVALVDGRFVLGEVKQSNGLFKRSDFDRMETVAKRLLPDMVCFCSMEPKMTPLIEANIERLRDTLGNLSVEVNWLALDDMLFEPSILP